MFVQNILVANMKPMLLRIWASSCAALLPQATLVDGGLLTIVSLKLQLEATRQRQRFRKSNQSVGLSFQRRKSCSFEVNFLKLAFSFHSKRLVIGFCLIAALPFSDGSRIGRPSFSPSSLFCVLRVGV